MHKGALMGVVLGGLLVAPPARAADLDGMAGGIRPLPRMSRCLRHLAGPDELAESLQQNRYAFRRNRVWLSRSDRRTR